MNQLYRKATAHPKRKMKPVRKIIAIAAIIAMLTGAAAATTFWEKIQQFFVTTFGQYVELQTNLNREIKPEKFSEIPTDWESFWCPKELGSEYSIVSAKTIGKRKVIAFHNDEGDFKLYQGMGDGSIRSDNEAKVVPGIFVGKQEAYAVEKEVNGVIYRTIFWTTGDNSFELNGVLAFKDLEEIANNLVLIER